MVSCHCSCVFIATPQAAAPRYRHNHNLYSMIGRGCARPLHGSNGPSRVTGKLTSGALAGRRPIGARVLAKATFAVCRTLARQNKRSEARTVFLPIYVRFTEGFDTPDLRDAEALRAELM